MNTKKVGNVGEEIAREYLLANGYKILEQNFVGCGCEVDIICQENNSLKTKQSLLERIKNCFSQKKSCRNPFCKTEAKECDSDGIEHQKKVSVENRHQADKVAKSRETNDNPIVFVEVKTRTSENYGTPLEAVTKPKQNRYIRAAKSYIVLNKKVNVDIRFDVIEVFEGKITHIKSAFDC